MSIRPKLVYSFLSFPQQILHSIPLPDNIYFHGLIITSFYITVKLFSVIPYRTFHTPLFTTFQ